MTMMPWTGLVTFVVVSFEDKEGDHAKVLNYVHNELEDAIECGLLVFRECREMEFWDCSVAKNTSHRTAWDIWDEAPRKLLLVNLDADNILGPQSIPSMIEKAASSPLCDPISCGSTMEGSAGRVGEWRIGRAISSI